MVTLTGVEATEAGRAAAPKLGEAIMAMRRIIFWRKMYYSSNTVLKALAKAGRENLFAVADAYNISVSEVLHVDNCTIKSLVWEHFVHVVNL